jgi:hypothetical protein
MKMTKIEKTYLKYLCAGAFSTWKGMEEKLKEDNIVCDQKDGTLEQCFMYTFQVSKEQFHNMKDKFAEQYKRFNNRAQEERVQEFGGRIAFCEWYMMEEHKCAYCGITQNELHDLREKRGGNLTLNGGEKRKEGYLEIEKRDPDKGYVKDNVLLACPFCNNAKSNLIDEKDWIEFFVPAMKQYLQTQLS